MQEPELKHETPKLTSMTVPIHLFILFINPSGIRPKWINKHEVNVITKSIGNMRKTGRIEILN